MGQGDSWTIDSGAVRLWVSGKSCVVSIGQKDIEHQGRDRGDDKNDETMWHSRD